MRQHGTTIPEIQLAQNLIKRNDDTTFHEKNFSHDVRVNIVTETLLLVLVLLVSIENAKVD